MIYCNVYIPFEAKYKQAYCGVNLNNRLPASAGTADGDAKPEVPSTVIGAKSDRTARSRTAYVVLATSPAAVLHAALQCITCPGAPASGALLINSTAVEPSCSDRAHTFKLLPGGGGGC